jgi:predicted nucleotidyltransferase
MDLEEIKSEVKRITEGLGEKEILAVGLFGSLSRGDFDEMSDIDIFVITEKEIPLVEQDELYQSFSPLISRFKKDVTVLFYDIESLKKIPTWQTLNLIKDAYFVYDRGEIEKLFGKILRKANEEGIVFDPQEKVFKLKKPERMIFALTE